MFTYFRYCVYFSCQGKPHSPGKPFASDIKATQMKVFWAPPDVDGGSPIIRYRLDYKEKTSTDWMPVNVNKSTDTTVVVKSLDEYTEYQFRVYAENEVGVSDVSTTTVAYRTLGTFYASKIIQFGYKK